MGESANAAAAAAAAATSNHGSVSIDLKTLRQREAHASAMDRLKRIYKAKLRPLEQAYKFSEFYSTELTDGDFDAKPFVLLIGGYSVGKTSFIRYMLERDFPSCRIGPEPTTDRFLAIMKSKPGQPSEGVVIPGNAGAIDIDRPFTSLGRFGISFLSRFEICEVDSTILDHINFVDTPGILSGEKQRMDRGYSFEQVVSWFAERADRILLLFDGNKLDISDELKRVIEILKGQDDKIRIVLNKADMIDSQQLMRVYGALMWSLGKVIKSPEVLRVYIGSFWDQTFQTVSQANHHLFSNEHKDLLSDLHSLPQQSAVRKINELVKRARLARVHALLINHLRNNMPWLWGHKAKQKRLALRLEEEYVKVQKAHPYVALGDFPQADIFRKGLDAFDLSEFPAISKRLLDVVDGALTRDIPKLMIDIGMTAEQGERLYQQEKRQNQLKQLGSSHDENDGSYARNSNGDLSTNGHNNNNSNPSNNNISHKDSTSSSNNDNNPFASQSNDSVDSSTSAAAQWAVSATAKRKWDSIFQSLHPSGSPPTLNGNAVRDIMLQSGLPQSALRKIWDLSDIDSNGLLEEDEFAVTMTLIRRARADGAESIPDQLPTDLIPPSRR